MQQPGNFWFHDTVSALAYSLAQAHADSPPLPPFRPPYNDLTCFILRQHGRMTDYLRTPILAATLGFDALAILSAGHRFHRLPPAIRRRQTEAWKSSNLNFKRDLIRFHESLTTLALFDRGSDSRETSALSPAQVSVPGAIQKPLARLHAEIVVVGSGPGGAITACLLAEAGRNVLLIEEGPFYALESCPPFSREEMEQKYRNGGLTVAMGKTKVAYVEGCCVGGGSEINSGLYHRTPPDILERWRKEFQVEAITEKEMAPHFEACERDLSVSPLPGAAPAASLKLHEGATRLGWKSLEVPRWFKYESAVKTMPQGTRQSMTKTFVPRFLKAGGQLLPQTRVRKLRQESGKWHLLACHARAGRLRIEAETVFLAAGAIQTPALLRRSGITRNVGNSLCLHPTVKVVAKFADSVNSADMGVPVHQVKEFAPRFSFGCSISSPAYLALGMLDHPQHASEVRSSWRQMANYYAMIVGEGHGTIRPLPGFRDPLVRYNLTANDHGELAKALRKLAEVLFAARALALYPSLTRGPALFHRDNLSKLPEVAPVGLTNLMTIHLFSSCPMGEDEARCATDSFGRVHRLRNLRIADASLLCAAPGVNPQGSIMALALRNTLHFLEKH